MEFSIGFDASQGGRIKFKCSATPKAGQESLVHQFIQCQALSLFIGLEPYFELATKQEEAYSRSCNLGFPVRCSKSLDSFQLKQSSGIFLVSSISGSRLRSACEVHRPRVQPQAKRAPQRHRLLSQSTAGSLETVAEGDSHESQLPRQPEIDNMGSEKQQLPQLRDFFRKPPSALVRTAQTTPETATAEMFNFDSVQSALRKADTHPQDVAANLSNPLDLDSSVWCKGARCGLDQSLSGSGKGRDTSLVISDAWTPPRASMSEVASRGASAEQ